MFKRNSLSDQIRQENESTKPKRDHMRLAYHNQSLLIQDESHSGFEPAEN